MFIDNRFKGKEGRERRETSMWERNTDWLPLAHIPTEDWARNLDMCPDWEPNPKPCGVWEDTPTNWATQTGENLYNVINQYYPNRFNKYFLKIKIKCPRVGMSLECLERNKAHQCD